MKEFYYDKLLNIKTSKAQKGFNKSLHYHRYEATPYQVLEALRDHCEFHRNDRAVDYGCGKGRLNFFIHYYFQLTVVGIEMNEEFYGVSLENLESYSKRHPSKRDNRIHFHCCIAEDYAINPLDNKFYFFNPFSIQIFMKVIHRIIESVEMHERSVELILYYPSEDYIFFLDNYSGFQLRKEIRIPHLYEHNSNERILIYHL